jgi:hypothetical protein
MLWCHALRVIHTASGKAGTALGLGGGGGALADVGAATEALVVVLASRNVTDKRAHVDVAAMAEMSCRSTSPLAESQWVRARSPEIMWSCLANR